MTEFETLYQEKKTTLEHFLSTIRSGDVIAVSGAVCEPTTFLSHVQDFAPNVEDVTIVKSRDNSYDYLRDPAMLGHVLTLSHFYSANFREGHPLGLCDYIPSDLHNYASVFHAVHPNNIFVAQVSPMDEKGEFCIPYCQMFENEALACARRVILEVNPTFRPVRGAVRIPIDRVDMLYEVDTPRTTIPKMAATETEQTIGEYVAELIHDGDCIQMGLGGLPDYVATKLMDKNDLGMHTELFTATMAVLVKRGVITGKKKTFHTGEHLATFVLGDEHLYDVVSEDPACRLVPASYGNDPFNIAKNDNMVSVNTALEIDLTGQICSESIGPRQFSGTGGATDYACGAFHAKGGRGIIAMASTAKGGTISKIKPMLTPGAAVSISRNVADYIITEYGAVRLRGRTVRERAEALISIAHPDFRGELRREAVELGYLPG